jgi:hypothetical protein
LFPQGANSEAHRCTPHRYYAYRLDEFFASRRVNKALDKESSSRHHVVIDQERKDNINQTYIKDSSLPYVDVEVKNVAVFGANRI